MIDKDRRLQGLETRLKAMGGCAAMVLIVDPLDRPRVNPDRLSGALDLTPAQAHVAAAVASGGTVQSIAASSHRSEAVVRWHLKQIMARLGLFGQTDLVRLVLTAPGVFQDP
ncbi:MAG: LuxR C-terminal-related transcriptional regulator [Gammaproteobacteria bacterium]|nr:LuxR C-terminal-related transcriptional regulator [Gammaproteobacteria bacterium]